MHPCSPDSSSVKRQKVAVDPVRDILSAAGSGKAAGMLSELQNQHFSEFLSSLSLELSTEPEDRKARKRKWMSFHVSFRYAIKEWLLKVPLGSEEAPHTAAAEIIGKIASIEIRKMTWPTLISSLLNNMTDDKPVSLKEATLEALGYVCQGISEDDHDHVLAQDEVEKVLSVVVNGMDVAKNSPHVRLAATRALKHALALDEACYRPDKTVSAVLGATAETERADIRQAAFECLGSVVSTHYAVLEPYREILVELTINALKGDETDLALPAIEFWSCICHKEMKLSRSGKSGHLFVETALTRLVSELVGTLLKQDQNDDICKLAVAGGTCLGLVARTVGDAVIPSVRPFVLENISNTDWRYRQAATRACGSYLEGISVNYLDSDLPYLLTVMKEDQDRHVQATAQSCVMAVVLERIKDSPEKTCGVIQQLSSSVLAPHLTDILISLVRTAERTDASNTKLISTAFETLKEVVRGSNPVESSQILTSLACCLVNKLMRLRRKQGDFQVLICGVLPEIFQKVSSTDETMRFLVKDADLITILLLRVLEDGSSLIREKTMLAVGALVCAIGPEFMKHMHLFSELLKRGLEDWDDHEVRFASYRVAGDLCRALDYKVLPFCQEIMSSLVRELCKGYIKDPNVKPVLFSCIGDMALAIGVHFEDYVFYVLPLMKEAADGCAESDGENENVLKRSIFKAYSGILQGCNRSKAELMKPHVSHLLNFLQKAVKKPNRDTSVARAAVAVLRDLALGPNAEIITEHFAFCMDFCNECLESKDEELIDTATRTLTIMKNRPEGEDQGIKVDIPIAGGTAVLKNISKPDWLSCAAVTWSYFDGLSFKELSEKVDFDLEILLDAMEKQKTRMKDGVEWTLSCILMLLHTPATGLPVILPKLPQMIHVLLGSIKDSPDVAERACGVIYYLAHGYSSSSKTTSLPDLKPFISDIIKSLIATTEREDANLSCAAYETLQEVVRCSDPVESLEAIAPVLRFLLNKFAKTMRLPKDSTRKLDLLAKICGGMQVTIEKLSSKGKHIISEVADKIMTLLPKVFIYKFRSSTVLEKAMLAIGALACATGPEFLKYMQDFYEHLETGLDNMVEYKVCSASVEVASDICRALGYRVLPFCSDLVPVLLRNLCSPKLHRSVVPLIFSCFGDIALAIGIYFEEHVSWVMRMMRDAADECAQHIDGEYGNQLKRSVLKAYSAILQGCKRSKPEILEPHAPHILKFVEAVVRDANNSDEMLLCRFVSEKWLESEDEQLKETATRIKAISSRCG